MNIFHFVAKTLASDGIDEIYDDVNSFNKASIRGLEKFRLNFIVDAHIRQFFTHKIYDVHMFNSEVWSHLSAQIQKKDFKQGSMES